MNQSQSHCSTITKKNTQDQTLLILIVNRNRVSMHDALTCLSQNPIKIIEYMLILWYNTKHLLITDYRQYNACYAHIYHQSVNLYSVIYKLK